MISKDLDSKVSNTIINLFRLRFVKDYRHPSGALELDDLKNDGISYDAQAKIYSGLWNVCSRRGRWTIFKRMS